MKHIYKYNIILLAIISAIAVSCTDDFEEINTNPNAPVSVQPSLLLRQVIYDYGEQMSYEGFVAGGLLSQHLTALDFNLFDRHALKSPQLGGDPWPIFYRNLRDNEIILEQAQTTPAFAVYEGPSLIFKAYMTAALTDIFGDVPYFEAFRGLDGTVQAPYDLQEDIYLQPGGILDNLDQGIAAIENYEGSIPLEGDVLFNGDLDGWVRFANSLKIKALMRISNKVDVSDQLQELFDEGNYISDNSENAVFNFTDGEPNNFRLARLRAGDFNNFVMSETMEEVLDDQDDARVEVLFRPRANNDDGDDYEGLINGIDASSTSVSLADFSLAGTIFRENTGMLDANYMTAWETNFLLAEAAQRDLIEADAEDLYETAVEQAYEYWNTELPEDYLDEEGAFDDNDNDPIEQIITQKWIASMINGYEGWIEWRRTGFPELKNVSASLNNGIIPVRMPYPTEEAALNADNYNVAASATDGNSINAPVWWDE
ncbi:SusD/RagB family nutrient-binding outer membrane lipoprotein [Nonlabens ponticola]|uniref:SusD/RagB family nutrient-binding outer membrane lipoprotein n=1 Tax=Nonlabens ponticola TaxID=2496866 RepID=A0A3S9MWP6_9FLAO|nr:SusD/RagB family nutrient-binding outer membrane lipoprotein [Nonlabens ponticola]AZQ43539.1 SusD/RagB family nutrient-binding outer membrane lipoprotein [Nonlabens ponticola]